MKIVIVLPVLALIVLLVAQVSGQDGQCLREPLLRCAQPSLLFAFTWFNVAFFAAAFGWFLSLLHMLVTGSWIWLVIALVVVTAPIFFGAAWIWVLSVALAALLYLAYRLVFGDVSSPPVFG